MVNSKLHLIRSYCEIFFYHFPNISCLKCTVNSKQNLADKWLQINRSQPVFLHLFVILFTGGVSHNALRQTPPQTRHTPPDQPHHPPGTPPPDQAHHPPEQTPPTPLEQTPPQTRHTTPPQTRHTPLTSHTPEQTSPPGADPPGPGTPPPGKQTPAYGLRAAGTHPTGMHSCHWCVFTLTDWTFFRVTLYSTSIMTKPKVGINGWELTLQSIV